MPGAASSRCRRPLSRPMRSAVWWGGPGGRRWTRGLGEGRVIVSWPLLGGRLIAICFGARSGGRRCARPA